MRKPYVGPSFMGGTLSAEEVRLAMALYLRPLAGEPGQHVEAFERAFAQAVQVPHATAFGTGRVALWAILRALDIGEGDEVVIPGYTCVAVPNAIRFAGARPRYADIDPQTFNVTAGTCERVLTPRTRALVVAHTYGLPAPMAELRELAEARGLSLIEDAAHALGSEHEGRPAGSLGHAAFFSTEHSKIISTALGGMATTADGALAARLRLLQTACPAPGAARVRRLLIPHLIFGLCFRTRQHLLGEWLLFRSRLYRRAEWSTADLELTGARPPGYFWRMGDAQARLGREQLRRLPHLNAARSAAVKAYAAAMRAVGLEPPAAPGGDQSSRRDLTTPGDSEERAPGASAARPVYVRLPYLARCRETLRAAASRENLLLGEWFEAPVHPKEADVAAIGYTVGSCPVAEKTSARIVNLPCHPGITPTDVERYVALLERAET